MALVKKSNSRAPITYVHLGRGEDSGFKLVRGSGTEKVVESFDHVTGIPAGFYMKPELIYEVAKDLRAKGVNPNSVDLAKYEEDQIKYVATLLLKDGETGEMVGVNFDMHDSLGGKLIGMLNTAIREGSVTGDFNLRTFYAAPKTKYNDSEKGRSSINMRLNQEGAVDLKPIYLTEGGEVLMDPEKPGQPGMLPMGTVAGRVKGKDIWEFSARNAVITETALAVHEHFKKDAPADNHTEEGGVDLDEAAAAAAPKP